MPGKALATCREQDPNIGKAVNVEGLCGQSLKGGSIGGNEKVSVHHGECEP